MNRLLDLLLLLLILPILIPIFLVICGFALIFHKNSIFFKQERLGINKKVFHLFKFRSMVQGAQHMGTGLYSFQDDNRITPFGKFLRTSSLDELPQLFNVLKGDMSFVGPRPAVLGELEQEENLPSDTDDRFIVKPGLTGWAQIHGRDNLTWPQKIKLDLEYVHASKYRRIYMTLYSIFYTPFYLLNFSATYEKK